VLVTIELVAFRAVGLSNLRAVAAGKPGSDRVSHLAGYATGTVAAGLVRVTDPKWNNIERHRYWDWTTKYTPTVPNTLEVKTTESRSTIDGLLSDHEKDKEG